MKAIKEENYKFWPCFWV